MEMSAVTQLLSMKMGQTQQLAQIAILRKAHQMDMALADMVGEASRSAPPPGQGRQVDKTA